MKKSRFTDSQIAEALKRVEAGLAVPELGSDRARYIGSAGLPDLYGE